MRLGGVRLVVSVIAWRSFGPTHPLATCRCLGGDATIAPARVVLCVLLFNTPHTRHHYARPRSTVFNTRVTLVVAEIATKVVMIRGNPEKEELTVPLLG